jgi:hypothetical protein
MRFKPSHPDSKLERRCKCTGGSLLDTAGISFNELFPIYQGFGVQPALINEWQYFLEEAIAFLATEETSQILPASIKARAAK